MEHPIQGHPENSTPVERRRRSSGKKGHPEPGTPVFGWRRKHLPFQKRYVISFMQIVLGWEGPSRGRKRV